MKQWNNHLVAGADAQGPQAQVQRVQPVGNTHAMFGLAQGCKLRLERSHLLAQHVTVGGQHGFHGRLQRGTDGVVLAFG